MLRRQTETETAEKQEQQAREESVQNRIEDIDDLIFQDCMDQKTHSER